jgi:hypothetical protein
MSEVSLGVNHNEPADDGWSDGEPEDEAVAAPAPALKARGYQLEMFQESMEQNIIVTVGLIILLSLLKLIRSVDGDWQWEDNDVPRNLGVHQLGDLLTLCDNSARLRIEAELERSPSKVISRLTQPFVFRWKLT